MLQAEEACGGGGGSATVEGCTMAGRVGGGGEGAQQHRPGKQHRDDNIQCRYGAP